jgi:hypothetical protein
MTVYGAQGRSRVRFPMGSLGFFIGLSFRLQYGPGVDSVYNRREYHGYLLGVGGRVTAARAYGLTTLLPSCAECRTSASLNLPEPRAYPGLHRDLFTFYGDMYESHGHSFLPIFPVSALQLLPSTVTTGLQPSSPSFVPPSTDAPFHMQ